MQFIKMIALAVWPQASPEMVIVNKQKKIRKIKADTRSRSPTTAPLNKLDKANTSNAFESLRWQIQGTSLKKR